MADLLIVDDNEDLGDLLEEILVDAGHHVRRAANGEQGLLELNNRAPDLVLLDVEMPVLDGPSMAYQMLVRDCGLEAIPIVLLSGVVGLEHVAARVGTPYFLGKPYSMEDIIAMSERALRERVPPVPRAEVASAAPPV
jgi:CheY-like chemotaxis protein